MEKSATLIQAIEKGIDEWRIAMDFPIKGRSSLALSECVSKEVISFIEAEFRKLVEETLIDEDLEVRILKRFHEQER